MGVFSKAHFSCWRVLNKRLTHPWLLSFHHKWYPFASHWSNSVWSVEVMDSDKLCNPVIKGRVDYSLYAGHINAYISHPCRLWNRGESNKIKIKLKMDWLLLCPMGDMSWSPVHTFYYAYTKFYFFLADIKTFYKGHKDYAQNSLVSNISLTWSLCSTFKILFFPLFTLHIYIASLLLYNFLLTYLKF